MEASASNRDTTTGRVKEFLSAGNGLKIPSEDVSTAVV